MLRAVFVVALRGTDAISPVNFDGPQDSSR
jgi:hypothetical protein